MGWLFAAPTKRPDDAAAAAPEGPATAPSRHAEWGFAEGASIADGRTVLERLGGGSRYEVFLVWDERLFALGVAKVLRPDLVDDPRALRELRREAEVLARLAHPCLVRGFGAVLDGPRPHLLLEHVEGPTLGRVIRRYGPVSLHQLLPLALHVTAVLQFLRGEGFVHLDVKPGNVVMGVPPRLIDLSIARPVEAAAHLRDAIGTDAYMAPEQCDPERSSGVGAPADVFGLGATLYHAASGRVPFPRPRNARQSADRAVRFPQLAAAPQPLDGVLPPAFRGIVHAMLAPRPEQRPTPADVAAALEPLVAAVPDRLFVSRRGRLVAPSS